MKRTLIAAAAIAAISSAAAFAQGYGTGPGMMGGYGAGYGMGPGMMGGYDGRGPGYGMGPGMMGGYGGYGPGYGMGPGMMGGYGGYGPGYGIPDLTSEQRTRLAAIQKEFRNRQWGIMESMQELGVNQADLYREGKFDEQAARKAFDARAELRKQMFENSLEARKRIDAVLTPQQREQLSQRAAAGAPCPGAIR